jgi:hypothetical protein
MNAADLLRKNQRYLRGALVTILGACGGIQTAEDGGADASIDVKHDVHEAAEACGPPQCCCFQYAIPCDSISYTWDASFPFCDDASAFPNCVNPSADCIDQNSELTLACQLLDPDSGDPYPTAGDTYSCQESSRDDAGVNVSCNRYFVCGRRFDGLIYARHDSGNACARALAEMAWLEAASVRAFSRLARDLVDHEAPRALVARAKRAAREESRHAGAMRRLANTHGAAPKRVAARPHRNRTLEEIATENAVEGCVGETYGALVALWQATHARDPDARAAFEKIAPDEIGHAALAWSIAEWAASRLDADARTRVARATDAALANLTGEREDPDATVVRLLGAPSAVEAQLLARALRRLANK